MIDLAETVDSSSLFQSLAVFGKKLFLYASVFPNFKAVRVVSCQLRYDVLVLWSLVVLGLTGLLIVPDRVM